MKKSVNNALDLEKIFEVGDAMIEDCKKNPEKIEEEKKAFCKFLENEKKEEIVHTDSTSDNNDFVTFGAYRRPLYCFRITNPRYPGKRFHAFSGLRMYAYPERVPVSIAEHIINNFKRRSKLTSISYQTLITQCLSNYIKKSTLFSTDIRSLRYKLALDPSFMVSNTIEFKDEALDINIVEEFKKRSKVTSIPYQILINLCLEDYILNTPINGTSHRSRKNNSTTRKHKGSYQLHNFDNPHEKRKS